MTDIEQKALALIQECVGSAIWKMPITRIDREHNVLHEALCRAIEQNEAEKQEIFAAGNAALDELRGEFEAYRQEVSDAVEQRFNHNRPQYGCLERFIIAKPEDPLVEAIRDTGLFTGYAEELAAAITKYGGKIVWGEG